MRKIAIVIGHTSGRDKGAFSEALGMSEFEYNFKLADELKKLAPNVFDVYSSDIQNYYNRQVYLANLINPQKYDLVIELHFNSFNDTSNGTEVLYYHDSKRGKEYAKIVSKHISELYGTKLRNSDGTKEIATKNDRGYWFLKLQSSVALLIEPFFGSNPIESKKFENIEDLACVIFTAINKFK